MHRNATDNESTRGTTPVRIIRNDVQKLRVLSHGLPKGTDFSVKFTG